MKKTQKPTSPSKLSLLTTTTILSSALIQTILSAQLDDGLSQNNVKIPHCIDYYPNGPKPNPNPNPGPSPTSSVVPPVPPTALKTANPTALLSLSNGLQDPPANTGCKQCEVEWYAGPDSPGSTNYKCWSCGAVCHQCKLTIPQPTTTPAVPAYTCSQCKAGFYLNSKNHCTKCSQFCTNCTSTACNTCRPGHFINGGLCGNCIVHCNVCLDSSSCDTCQDGYFRGPPPAGSQLKSTCIACSANCKQCSSGASCRVCDDGYRISAGLCKQQSIIEKLALYGGTVLLIVCFCLMVYCCMKPKKKEVDPREEEANQSLEFRESIYDYAKDMNIGERNAVGDNSLMAKYKKKGNPMSWDDDYYYD